MKKDSFEILEEFKNLLDVRYEQYKTGKVEMVSEEESKARVKRLLESSKNIARS